MANLTLIVGNKNYSSWSLRGYLSVQHVGQPFDEVVIPLAQSESATAAAIARYSPAGRVPILKHGDLTVWDSLAIAEYLAETFPEAKLWPSDPIARAVARAVSAEMHSGFPALRTSMPMNLRASKPGRSFGADVLAEVERIKAIWRDCRKRFGAGGPFLFGAFTNADAMFGPVTTRFRTYGVALDALEQAYVDAVWNLPAMQTWIEAARAEPWAIAHYEAV